MSSANEEKTPEEKLLALIQQDKRQDESASNRGAEEPKGSPAATSASASAQSQAPAVVPTAQAVSPPSTDEKLKLASLAAAPAAGTAQTVPDPPSKRGGVVAPSPEERRSGTAAGDKEAPGAVGQPPAAVPEAEAPSARLRMVSFRQEGLALFNRVLALVVLVLMILVVYSVTSIRADVAEEVAKQVSGVGSVPSAPLILPNDVVPPLDFYLEKVAKRDIFLRPGDQMPTTNAVPVERTEDLKLVAVSIDTASPAESMAIIKSKTSAKTHVVKVGQGIGSTGFTLERVLPDHVVVKNNKQEFELK